MSVEGQDEHSKIEDAARAYHESARATYMRVAGYGSIQPWDEMPESSRVVEREHTLAAFAAARKRPLAHEAAMKQASEAWSEITGGVPRPDALGEAIGAYIEAADPLVESEARERELEERARRAELQAHHLEAEAEKDDAERAVLVEALKEARDALAMYVAGVEGDRHAQGTGAVAEYHASSSAGGRKTLDTIDAALAGVVEAEPCGALSPESATPCTEPKGHEGAHRGPDPRYPPARGEQPAVWAVWAEPDGSER